MAIKEYNVDLDVKGRVLATTVPNSTGSIVTWNSSTNVFGLRTNAQIIADLGLTTTLNNKANANGDNLTNIGTWQSSLGIGDLTALTTTNKNDLVGAINEVNGKSISKETTPINTIGWYTIAKNKSDGDGGYGENFIVMVQRTYANANNESYTFSINLTHGKATITQLSGNFNSRIITKVRVVNNVLNQPVYVELYYAVNNANTITVVTIGDGISLPATVAPTPSGSVNEIDTVKGVNTLEGYNINGRTNSDILLAGGGHRPVSDFALASAIPTVNNGQLTLSTGTGLSGSATFSANQSGSSTFSIAVASTHKLPTTAEWASALVNNTYTAGTGLSLSGTVFGQAITTSGTGSFVTGITQTSSGFQVNLGTPPNTNTTYSSGTLALLQQGTSATNRVWSAVILAQRFNQFQSGMAYINTDTENIDTNVNWGTNVIYGARNQIQGARNIVKGEDINIFGSRNISSGRNNQINGFANVANGAFNTINGAYSSITGSQANTIGNYLFARDKQTVLGMYNKVYDVGADESLRVAIGTGSNDFDKFNAVEIYDDHRTEFHGKAVYDEKTRDPEWFTEDYTHVDTYQMGYDHLPHAAGSSTPCEYGIFEVVVRGNDRFARVNAFPLAFRIHGIVKGNLIESNIDRTKVHTKGTLEFSDAVRLALLERANIEKNPYLVVEYNFVKGEIYVKYVDAFYLKDAKSQDDKIIYMLGSFINKRGSSGQPDITYFEFNQQII